jgi:hypothetical protein
MSGFASYLLTDQAAAWFKGLEGFADFAGLFKDIFPWLCIAVIIIGIGWFWVMAPLLAFTSPRQE